MHHRTFPLPVDCRLLSRRCSEILGSRCLFSAHNIAAWPVNMSGNRLWACQNCDGNNKNPEESSHDEHKWSPAVLKHQLSFKDWINGSTEMSSSINDAKLMISVPEEFLSNDEESMNATPQLAWINGSTETSSSINDAELMISVPEESLSNDEESMNATPQLAEEEQPTTPQSKLIGLHGDLGLDAEPCTPPSQILSSIKGGHRTPPAPRKRYEEKRAKPRLKSADVEFLKRKWDYFTRWPGISRGKPIRT